MIAGLTAPVRGHLHLVSCKNGDIHRHPAPVRSLRGTSILRAQCEEDAGHASEGHPVKHDGEQREPMKAVHEQPKEPIKPDDDIDPEMRQLWANLKETIKGSLDKENAQVMDSLEVEDVMNPNKVLDKMITETLGPVLQSMGVQQEPVEFFVGLLQMAIGFQLVSCSLLFLSLKLGSDLDTGEDLRCTAGLLLGYVSRPFFNVEQLFWPLYQTLLRLISPTVVYDVSSTPTMVQATLNRVGITVAVCFLLPQVLWGWTTGDAAQFVGPLASGWILFDLSLLLALFFKLGL